MSQHNNLLPRTVNIVKLKMVREEKLGYNNVIYTAKDVVALVRTQIQDSYREMVLVVGVDITNRPTVVHTVSLGGVSQAGISISSVFKPLLLSNSSAFFLIHNHPASTLVPSTADKVITKRLKTIGEQLEIRMLDHLILNADGSDYFSFTTQGVL